MGRYNKFTSEQEIEQTIESIQLEVPKELKGVMMNMREYFISEGEARGEARGEAKGEVRGRKLAAKEIGLNMLRQGTDVELVSKFLDIPLALVKQLRDSLKIDS